MANKQDKFDVLPHDVKRKLLKAKDFYPVISKGHGSLRKGFCNVQGCNLGDTHYQDRIESAYNALRLN